MSLPDKKSRIECDVLAKILPSLEGLYTPPKRDKTKKTETFPGGGPVSQAVLFGLPGEVHTQPCYWHWRKNTRAPESLPSSPYSLMLPLATSLREHMIIT